MYFLGQTVKFDKENKPAIYLGSETDLNDYVAYIFCKEEGKKTFDTIMVDLSDLSRFIVEAKDTPTKRTIYKGDCVKGTMVGMLPEKDCLALKGDFIKELNKATKQFFK